MDEEVTLINERRRRPGSRREIQIIEENSRETTEICSSNLLHNDKEEDEDEVARRVPENGNLNVETNDELMQADDDRTALSFLSGVDSINLSLAQRDTWSNNDEAGIFHVENDIEEEVRQEIFDNLTLVTQENELVIETQSSNNNIIEGEPAVRRESSENIVVGEESRVLFFNDLYNANHSYPFIHVINASSAALPHRHLIAEENLGDNNNSDLSRINVDTYNFVINAFRNIVTENTDFISGGSNNSTNDNNNEINSMEAYNSYTNQIIDNFEMENDSSRSQTLDSSNFEKRGKEKKQCKVKKLEMRKASELKENLKFITNDAYHTSYAVQKLGLDVQGISWNNMSIRDEFRLERMHELTELSAHQRTWTNEEEQQRLSSIHLHMAESCKKEKTKLYSFFQSYRKNPPVADHFQLRHMIHSPSSFEVFFVSKKNGMSLVHKINTINYELSTYGDESYRISSICAKHGLLVSGNFDGLVDVFETETARKLFSIKVTDNNSDEIVNFVDIINTPMKGVSLISCSNDNSVREFDVKTTQQIFSYYMNEPINHAAVSYDGKLIVITGDTRDIVLHSRICGKNVHKISNAHFDFGFSSAWNPKNQNIFVSANQDGIVKFWDIRNLKESFQVIGGICRPIRCVYFSPCGKYLTFGEGDDFVHILDLTKNFANHSTNTVDFFGGCSGISFSPDSKKLFIGLIGSFGCILEYRLGDHFSNISFLKNFFY